MTIKIDRMGQDKMIVYIPWRGGLGRDLAKTVHGGRWNEKHGGWVFPLDWQICKEVRQYISTPMNEPISLMPGMKEWAVEEKKRQDSIPSLLSTEGWPVPRLAEVNPKLHAAVSARPFQTRAIAFAAKTRRALLAHDPGLGKTLSAIGAMQEGDVTGLIMVIAPNSAVNISWPSLLAEWAPEDYMQIVGPNLRPGEREEKIDDLMWWAKENPSERCWVLMNPYWIRMQAEIDDYGKYVRNDKGVKILSAELPALFEVEWSGIVADESHQTLACSTGNAKKWSQQRVGLGALKKRDDAILMSISGTPMRGRPENLFGQLAWLRPDIYKAYWKWIRRHFHTYEDSEGGSAPEMGELKSKEKFFEEASIVMYRVTKEEVAKDLPPKRYGGTRLVPGDENSVLGVWLPMTGKQKTNYSKIVGSLELELNDGHVMRPEGILAMMTRLKQFASSCVEFDRYDERRRESDEWLEWNKRRTEAADLSELKAMLIDEGDDGAAETILVEDPGEEPYKWEVDEAGNDKLFEDLAVYEPRLPSNKFDWILQFLIDRDLIGKDAKGKQKVILASQFTKLLNLFSKELEKKGCPNFLLTGETPMKRRVQIVKEFQDNPDSPKVFLLNTKAGGTALTLDQADDVIIIDETFDPDDQLQVEDRAHRLSNVNHQVTIWYLRSLDTIEEKIGSTTTMRENICRGIMDGSRGIDTVKTIVGVKK